MSNANSEISKSMGVTLQLGLWQGVSFQSLKHGSDLFAENLAACADRNFFNKVDPSSQKFVMGDFGLDEIVNLLPGGILGLVLGGVGAELDKGTGQVGRLGLVVPANNCSSCHFGVTDQDAFEFSGSDLETLILDNLLKPVYNRKLTRSRVDNDDVASAEEAVGCKRCLGLFRVREVAREDLVAFDKKLASFARGDRLSARYVDHFCKGRGDEASDRPGGLLSARRVKSGEGELSHPPTLLHFDAGHLGELGFSFSIEWSSATANALDGGKRASSRTGVLCEFGQRRRNAVEQIDSVLLERFAERVCGERTKDEQLTLQPQHEMKLANETVGVEEGEEAEHAHLLLVETLGYKTGRAEVHREHRDEVGVRDLDRFGQTGGPRAGGEVGGGVQVVWEKGLGCFGGGFVSKEFTDGENTAATELGVGEDDGEGFDVGLGGVCEIGAVKDDLFGLDQLVDVLELITGIVWVGERDTEAGKLGSHDRDGKVN